MWKSNSLPPVIFFSLRNSSGACARPPGLRCWGIIRENLSPACGRGGKLQEEAALRGRPVASQCPSGGFVHPSAAPVRAAQSTRGRQWLLALCALSVLFRRKVNCQSCEGEAYSLLTIFNLKMQMLLVSRSLIRVPLCHALTSIREDYENIATLAFYKCHYDSTCCTNAWLSH